MDEHQQPSGQRRILHLVAIAGASLLASDRTGACVRKGTTRRGSRASLGEGFAEIGRAALDRRTGPECSLAPGAPKQNR
jgi:hypothetical protein